jgi:hypothetical protein
MPMDGRTVLDKVGPGRLAKPKGRTQQPEPAAPTAPPVIEASYQTPFPDDPHPDAFHGLAGDLVRTIDAHTEASRVAVLVQTLTAFGNVIGTSPHFKVENTKHPLNLFAVIVGQTAKGRKGTSWNRVLQIFEAVDPTWVKERICSGMSSGEGLIWEVRDPVFKEERMKETTGEVHFERIQVAQGISDKRLMVQEAEFASALKQGDRSGNILSAVIRQAWENGNIKCMSKNSPAHCTGAHISIIGHITAEELRRYLSSTEVANGFGNRFMWVVVRRSKLLPEGGQQIDMSGLVSRFADAVSFARHVEQMPRDDEARELWHKAYVDLSKERGGLIGALLGRAEAQTMRLACLYALLDLSCQVEAVHLRAALALWSYCERSTAFIFGESTGDAVADDILSALRKKPEGMSRNDIVVFFSGHQTKERVERSLLVLEAAELAKRETLATGGRPKEIWTYVPARKAR